MKKKPILIVGMCSLGMSVGRAMAEALATANMKHDVVIIGCGSGDTTEKKEEKVNNQFGNPPMKIENLRCFEPLQEVRLEFNNPWPSPKGRKGKKKW